MMMRRRLVALAVCWSITGTMVAAQEFWDKTPFNRWTDGQLKKVTSDSPWVKRKTMVLTPTGTEERPLFGRGSGTGGGSGRGTGGGGGPRSSAPGTTIVISWQSALPLRQAGVRFRMGAPGEVPADAVATLGKPADAYIVLLSGIPMDLVRLALGESTREAAISAGNREIALMKLETAFRGDNLDIILMFDRSRPITLQDKTAEVRAHIGFIDVKVKFDLKKMVVGGALEL